MAQPKQEAGVKVVARNRRARHDFSVEQTLEAGLELAGSEVKSLRDGNANLTDSYALPEKNQLWLHHLNIGPYQAASLLGHSPLRKRRLLLHRRQLDKLIAEVKERGVSLIPLQVYFKNGWAKVELAVARGKNHGDRREDIIERESRREMDRAVKSKRSR